jgi:hypothetical protein
MAKKKIDPLNRKQYSAVSGMDRFGHPSGRALLPKGLRLHKTRHHEWPRGKADAYRGCGLF